MPNKMKGRVGPRARMPHRPTVGEGRVSKGRVRCGGGAGKVCGGGEVGEVAPPPERPSFS